VTEATGAGIGAASGTLPGMPIVGDVLAGRYRIEAPIGAGGMASVYRARDLRLERDVAIKVLLPNLAADPALARRFDREARALAAAAHPNVVNVFDVEPGDPATGREPFYVMELCGGGSLAERLAQRGRLPPGEVAAVITAVADGLADLHRHGFVHRDVKPHNILFAGERAKLADFGLARPADRSDLTALTAVGATVGTLAYLAPELLGSAPASAASDVYALGVVAFQGLTGRLPRAAASVTDLVESHARPAPLVSSVAPELGTAYDGPVSAALATDPRARPSPLALAAGLSAGLAAGPGAARLVPPPVDPSAATVAVRRRPATVPQSAGPRPGFVALGAFGLVLAGLVALASLFGGRGPNAPGTTPSATITAEAPSPSPSPTLSPSPSPSPSPTPTPTPDPATPAFAALDRVDSAIDELAGDDDVRNRDISELRKRAGDVREALLVRDYDAARGLTRRLADKVDDVAKDADGDRIDELRNAVEDLAAAIPGG
jgi:serine/threonine protein kinase